MGASRAQQVCVFMYCKLCEQHRGAISGADGKKSAASLGFCASLTAPAVLCQYLS